MQLKRIQLVNFRGYEQEVAHFAPGLNCIEGLNGSGKSNLLEAIYLISTGKSFRTHKLQDLIRHEENTFGIEALFDKEGISHTLSIFFGKEGRKVFYNQTAHTSFLPLLGILPSILLCPEDISIINGGPAERRRFLDLHLAQIDPLYIHHLGRYQRALKQRNIQLKKKEEKGLSIWEELMATSSYYLLQKRIETLSILNEIAKPFLLELSNQKEPLEMIYESSLPLASSYTKKWEEMRKRELDQGTTLIGPHRDDICFLLNGVEGKTYASEGQKRCFLAALRLAEWTRLQSLLPTAPLFAIDDFGAHLDQERLLLLQDSLKKMGQVFLTAPSFSFASQANRICAVQNTITVNRKKDSENTHGLEEKP